MIMKRRDLLKYSAGMIPFIGAVPGVLSGNANANDFRDSDGSSIQHLFADNRIIARKKNVSLSVNPCRKHDIPVIAPEKSWEQDRVYIYGSVCRNKDTNTYRMWYMSRLTDRKERKDFRLTAMPNDLVLYAESKDGLDWHKPKLERFTFDGSPGNNIIFDFHSPNVLFEPHDPDENRRYKMLGYSNNKKHKGYCAACSPDGFEWKMLGGKPVIPGGDTITLMKNPLTGDYHAYHKQPKDVRGFSRRTVWLSKSSDFEHWSEPELVFAPDEQDDLWANGDEQRTEFYNMTVFFTGGMFLGLVSVLRVSEILKETKRNQSRTDGPVYTELVYSYDGADWRRFPERTAIIPNGPSSWDAGCILGVSNPVIAGDEVWAYYTGINTTHGGAMPPKKCVIGRAAWRRDGFVSLTATDNGFIETVPVGISGNALILNADASHGRILVELLDQSGRILHGYEKRNCNPVSNNGVAQLVSWKSNLEIPRNRPLRLRFFCDNAELYGFGG